MSSFRSSASPVNERQVGIDAGEKHYYLMTGVQAGRTVHRNKALSQFISKDLPIFSTVENNFFVTRVDANKGIQCRFGMKGVIAEAHYDGGRNMVRNSSTIIVHLEIELSPYRQYNRFPRLSTSRHFYSTISVLLTFFLWPLKRSSFSIVRWRC